MIVHSLKATTVPNLVIIKQMVHNLILSGQHYDEDHLFDLDPVTPNATGIINRLSTEN